MVKFINVVRVLFPIAFVIGLEPLKEDVPCYNNGILKKIQGSCFCDGTGYYGEKCELPCIFGEREEYKHIIPEKCLSTPCIEVPSSCIDIKLDLDIERPPIDRNIYPVCQDEPEFCMDQKNNFHINLPKKSIRVCENGGILKTFNHTSACMCKGTKHYGDYCEKNCDELGNIIPEKCLNGPCDFPNSCVDLGRNNLTIDRCKNGGVFTVGKTKNTCFCHGTSYWDDFCERECFSKQPAYCKDNPCPDLFPTECIF